MQLRYVETLDSANIEKWNNFYSATSGRLSSSSPVKEVLDIFTSLTI